MDSVGKKGIALNKEFDCESDNYCSLLVGSLVQDSDREPCE